MRWYMMASNGIKKRNTVHEIIDVDSADSRGGLTYPASEFIRETFLLSVKRALPQHILFVVNFVSRSQAVKDMVVSRMKSYTGGIAQVPESGNKAHHHRCYKQVGMLKMNQQQSLAIL
ncbi:hypothetical protein Bca52824_024359 [Brassica carinata]|uniref:Uncharacterized protein n=1 Tax=Brassica carinata TaxID=52824 RepID=A0A8X8AVJ3_BRACI|nr:hypothetical protein Bca52824_024359 [Brassica carinata]